MNTIPWMYSTVLTWNPLDFSSLGNYHGTCNEWKGEGQIGNDAGFDIHGKQRSTKGCSRHNIDPDSDHLVAWINLDGIEGFDTLQVGIRHAQGSFSAVCEIDVHTEIWECSYGF